MIVRCTGALIGVLALAPVAGATGITHARNLAAACAACHTRGGAGLSAIPPLEGKPQATLRDAMRAFKSGARAGTVMPQLARGYSDADIDAIAAWYAAQKR